MQIATCHSNKQHVDSDGKEPMHIREGYSGRHATPPPPLRQCKLFGCSLLAWVLTLLHGNLAWQLSAFNCNCNCNCTNSSNVFHIMKKQSQSQSQSWAVSMLPTNVKRFAYKVWHQQKQKKKCHWVDKVKAQCTPTTATIRELLQALGNMPINSN